MNDSFYAVTFNLHLIEPVLVSQVNVGDPNSATGLNFIPGSSIRGAIINKYLHENTIDAADPEFASLFLDSTVFYLNAYPQTADGKRMLPTPLSWRRDKEMDLNAASEKRVLTDFAIKQNNSDIEWKSITKPFCWLESRVDEEGFSHAELFSPEMRADIHIATTDHQHVQKDSSTVFRYQVLAPGQDFLGVIVSNDVSKLLIIANLIYNYSTMSIGKSHIAGYGQVRVRNVSDPQDTWKEYPVSSNTPHDNIAITLLSDTIVRDYQTGACSPTLTSVLGVPPEKAFTSCHVVGGFNRKWNLPLIQDWAIKMGSVFVYNSSSEIFNKLTTLEHQGVGERREEGYGRIAINWQGTGNILLVENRIHNRNAPQLTEANKTFAQRIVKRILRERLDQLLVQGINGLSIIQPHPKNSQLSSLRNVLRNALKNGKADLIFEYFRQMKKTAGNQFERSQIEGQSLVKWITKLAGDPKIIWVYLRFDRENLPMIGGESSTLTDALALEYALRLIDGIFHKAYKQEQSKEEISE